MNEVKWIKVSTDLINNRKIQHIRSMKNGNIYILVWFYMMILAGQTNNSGKLMYLKTVPYDAKNIGKVCGIRSESVSKALEVFLELEMITQSNGVYEISNWEEYQNAEALERIRENNRQRVARYRANHGSGNENVTPSSNVTNSYSNALDVDVDVDLDKDVEEENKNNKKIDSFSSLPSSSENETDMDTSLSFVGYLPAILDDMVKEKVIDQTKKQSYEKLIMSFKNNISVYALEQIIHDFNRVVFQMDLQEPTKYQTLELTLRTYAGKE